MPNEIEKRPVTGIGQQQLTQRAKQKKTHHPGQQVGKDQRRSGNVYRLTGPQKESGPNGPANGHQLNVTGRQIAGKFILRIFVSHARVLSVRDGRAKSGQG